MGIFSGIRKVTNNVEENENVVIQVIDRPLRKVIIKRGKNATDYWTYCQEVGCDVWGILTNIKSLYGEPVCLWLPEQYRKPGTSEYVQGVEVADNFEGPVPDGLEVITLPDAKYMMFKGEPFEEENYYESIEAVQTFMNSYSPAVIGYFWDDSNPRIQLEPIGTRGYIELRAVK
jgi:hypothetical protein